MYVTAFRACALHLERFHTEPKIPDIYGFPEKLRGEHITYDTKVAEARTRI
jgi:hypothetical protein